MSGRAIPQDFHPLECDDRQGVEIVCDVAPPDLVADVKVAVSVPTLAVHEYKRLACRKPSKGWRTQEVCNAGCNRTGSIEAGHVNPEHVLKLSFAAAGQFVSRDRVDRRWRVDRDALSETRTGHDDDLIFRRSGD